MLRTEDRSQLSGVFHMNISCSYIRIHDHAGVKRVLLKTSIFPAGDSRKCCLNAVRDAAFGTERLRPILTDESGIRPADCNLEIPSCPCQIWATSRFMGLFISNWKCRHAANFHSLSEKPTGETDPRQPDANLYENVQFDLSNFISEGKNRWISSFQRRLADSVINNSFAFRPAALLLDILASLKYFYSLWYHYIICLLYTLKMLG